MKRKLSLVVALVALFVFSAVNGTSTSARASEMRCSYPLHEMFDRKTKVWLQLRPNRLHLFNAETGLVL